MPMLQKNQTNQTNKTIKPRQTLDLCTLDGKVVVRLVRMPIGRRRRAAGTGVRHQRHHHGIDHGNRVRDRARHRHAAAAANARQRSGRAAAAARTIFGIDHHCELG
jgi:hypothetical protein